MAESTVHCFFISEKTAELMINSADKAAQTKRLLVIAHVKELHFSGSDNV